MENKHIKVLFVDDDTTFGDIITKGLTYLGYSVHYQSSLIAMENIIQVLKPNIIILDIEIGDKDGIDDSKKFRQLFPNIPIIFISSHIDPFYTEKSLKNGGAIYLKKPIEIDELSAYINKYAITNIDNISVIGQFTLNLDTRILFNIKTNQSQQLNKKEYELLHLLAENKEIISTRNEIIKEIWDGDFSSDKVLNNYINKIRKYLSGDSSVQIITVPREGYLFSINKIE